MESGLGKCIRDRVLQVRLLTKNNCRSFDSAGAKKRTCSAQDDSSFVYQAFAGCLYFGAA
jgi:hypothetical protein